MQLSRYAFIVKGPDYFPEQHTSELRSPKFSTRVVGVSDYQTALLIAKQLIADGIQLIELCGGFTESEAVQLQLSTGKRIPIGVVKYDDVLE